jgi:hypothetical protein
MSGNSIIPSDAKFDAYHGHRCLDCAVIFDRMTPVADETEDGDLCADCAAEREMRKEKE